MSFDSPPIFTGPPIVQDAPPPAKPVIPELDPRWEWIEAPTYCAPGSTYIRGRCNHLPGEVVPVESVEGETVAHLCKTCDTQLPAEWKP